MQCTLESGIDAGPGNFGKNNKCKALNKHRAWNIHYLDAYCESIYYLLYPSFNVRKVLRILQILNIDVSWQYKQHQLQIDPKQGLRTHEG